MMGVVTSLVFVSDFVFYLSYFSVLGPLIVKKIMATAYELG